MILTNFNLFFQKSNFSSQIFLLYFWNFITQLRRSCKSTLSQCVFNQFCLLSQTKYYYISTVSV